MSELLPQRVSSSYSARTASIHQLLLQSHRPKTLNMTPSSTCQDPLSPVPTSRFKGCQHDGQNPLCDHSSGHLTNGGMEHGPLEWNAPHFPWDVFKPLPEELLINQMGDSARCAWHIPNNTLGAAKSDQHPPSSSDPTQQQVVVIWQLCSSLYPSVQTM